MLRLIFLAYLVGHLVDADRLCTDDSQCSDLGPELICLKRQCLWGLCGCPRHTVAKYFGSEMLFKCVPLRKIGEKCSNTEPIGMCGAPNSECKDDICECETNFYKVFGGELCAPIGHQWPTENYKVLSSTIPTNPGTCQQGGQAYWPGTQSRDIFSIINGCTCLASRSRTDLIEVGGSVGGSTFDYRKYPICVGNRVGIPEDLCFGDFQCPGNPVTHCKNHYCQCDTSRTGQSNYVPNEQRNGCIDPLGYGATCSRSRGLSIGVTSGKVCDSSKGLRCGDVCDVRQHEALFYGKELDTGTELKCVCDVAYQDTGSSCSPRGIGSSCFGDYNCKAAETLGPTGICVNSVCAAEASDVVIPVGLIALLTAITLAFNV